VSGVRPAPDQLKDRPDLRFGKLVHQVMQFSRLALMPPEYEDRLEKAARLAGGEICVQVARGSSQAGSAYYRYGP
jgi:hypothetical protein